jgi:hypothetical protein
LMRQADKFTDFAGRASTVVINWLDFNVRPFFTPTKSLSSTKSFCS